jgi:hypothetical protein
MNPTRLTWICLSALLLLTASPAVAAVCVEVDPSRDTLPEPDRKAAINLLTHTLWGQGQEVATTNCSGRYTVSHIKFGNSITVFMQGPQGTREATVRSMDEVPPLYSQMVRSLLLGQPMNATGDALNRNNVTSNQAAPNRAEADSIWFLRLGYGLVTGPATKAGPAFGFGYRYELDNIGIEASFLNMIIASGATEASVNASWVKLMALYFTNPVGNRSAYFGGGLSWGATGLYDGTRTYEGSGLQGEVTAGYELLRASTIRLFVQFDATLPFYSSKSIDIMDAASKSSWTPVFAASFGVGWGKGVRTVHVIQ